jgi:hypothetical protein
MILVLRLVGLTVGAAAVLKTVELMNAATDVMNSALALSGARH